MAALIDTPEAANRLARAIASDLSLTDMAYWNTELQESDN